MVEEREPMQEHRPIKNPVVSENEPICVFKTGYFE